MSAYPALFSPLRIGRRQVRNRVAVPATLTNFGQNNRITERWGNYLIERAKGGAGLIVSEIIAVDPEAHAIIGLLASGGARTKAKEIERTLAGVIRARRRAGSTERRNPVHHQSRGGVGGGHDCR